jgi:hypothetical protein
VEDLKDGAHIKAKTIAELGHGGTPVAVIPYTSTDAKTWQPVPNVLIANLHRESTITSVAAIEEANRGEGMKTPVPMNTIAGIKHEGAPFGGVYRIADQNAKLFVALRRDGATGHSQFVSYDKGMVFRISDFEVSDYLFKNYEYKDEFQNKVFKPGQNMLKAQEGYPELVRP